MSAIGLSVVTALLGAVIASSFVGSNQSKKNDQDAIDSIEPLTQRVKALEDGLEKEDVLVVRNAREIESLKINQAGSFNRNQIDQMIKFAIREAIYAERERTNSTITREVKQEVEMSLMKNQDRGDPRQFYTEDLRNSLGDR